MKKSYKLSRHINSEIKVGDRIKIVDGSGLTSFKEIDVYIIYSYLELTGSELKLKEIEGTVLETNIDNFIHPIHSLELAYLQDIVIELGNAKFRTSSNFIRKI